VQFSVGNASNATAEIAAADHFPLIRMMTVGRVTFDETELARSIPWVEQVWSVASAKAVGGPWGTNFSAVCWYFGRDVFLDRHYPIGLVSANWGATNIETWMSPAALATCAHLRSTEEQFEATSMGSNGKLTPQLDGARATLPVPPISAAPNCSYIGAACGSGADCCGGRCFFYERPPLWPAGGYCDERSPSNSDSALWNSIIHPLLRMAIYGAVFYQGESDCSKGAAPRYSCNFPSLIQDWRKQWHSSSGTDEAFPFGFVQLSTWGGDTSGLVAPSDDYVPTVRLGQTANYGFAPNPSMQRTWMAVAVDLGAWSGGCCAGSKRPAGPAQCSTYPNLCIHPQWKQEVGRRLALGARAVAYKSDGVYFQGPIAQQAVAAGRAANGGQAVRVYFRGCGASGIELRRALDFDLRVGGKWVLAVVVVSDSTSVTLAPHNSTIGSSNSSARAAEGGTIDMVRYLFSRAPCSHPSTAAHADTPRPGNCSVYAKAEGLPAAPFLLNVTKPVSG
jgi:hypothetical protein